MANLGILMDPLFSPTDLVELARQVESWGIASFWYPDEKYFRDCYVGLTLVAMNTHHLRLGPCVTDPYSRHPIQTAAAVGSLAEIAPGRVWLGIGAGGRGLREIGLQPERPAVAIREAIEIIRGLLAGKSVNYHGQILSLQDLPLDYQPPDGIKIMIGTGHGRLVQQLAGEIADAAMLANYATPESIQKGIKWIERGATKAGRSLKDIFLISRIDVAVHLDSQLARAAVAPRILSHLRSSYPELNYLEDLPEFELSSRLLGVLRKKDYRTKTFYSSPINSAPLIPSVLTDNLAIAGLPSEVAERLDAIAKLGFLQEVTVRPIPAGEQSMFDSLSLFHETVLPELQQFSLGGPV